MSSASADALRRWERAGLVAAAVAVLAFGAVVEVRAAFQSLRRTDFGVYARAGWAVRSGADLYGVTDDRGWHYCYPPPFAVLVAPLADPPPGEPRDGFLPFPVAVAVWYLLGVAAVGFAADRFAAAVLPGERRFGRRWWYARTVPVYVCLGGVGFTLARGQVNTLVLALVAGLFAAAVRGRRFRAGLWLGAAACVKVIPAFLGLWLLLRRDARAAAGVAAATAVGLAVIPAAVWGPAAVLDVNAEMLRAVLQPGVSGTGDQTRTKELTGGTATDSQSIQAVLHNLAHPDWGTRPADVAPLTRAAHWAVGGLLTLAVAAVAVRRGVTTLADQLVLLGVLCLLMLHLAPVSHMHYYAYGLPLVAGLWLKGMAGRPGAMTPGRSTVLAVVGWGVATSVPLFPGAVADRMREFGFGPAASLLLGVFAMTRLAATGGGARPALRPPSRLNLFRHRQPT
jgi:hypothetical protein